MPPTYPLEVYQGQVKSVDFMFTNEDGSPYNLTGRKIIVTVRKHPSSEVIILEKTSDTVGDVTVLDAAAGHARCVWAKVDSAELAPRTYSWDVWLVTGVGPVPWLAPSDWVVKLADTKPSQT
jgi:hypothetical protein